jgi:hypothetical protein
MSPLGLIYGRSIRRAFEGTMKLRFFYKRFCRYHNPNCDHMEINPASHAPFPEYINGQTVSIIDCQIHKPSVFTHTGSYKKRGPMKTASSIIKAALVNTRSTAVITTIASLMAVSFPVSAQWVFKTGETIASPRSETINRLRSNQTASSRPSVVDMSQETKPVQNTTGPRADQRQYNSNRGYSNREYANQQSAQYNTNSNQQEHQQQNNSSAPCVKIKQNPDAPKVRLLLSSWAGDGELEWTHNARASEPAFGDPTSRLNYSGASSKIIDLGVAVDIANGFYAEVHYGSGEIDSGLLVDDDYLSADGAGLYGVTSTSDVLFSRTESPISEQDVGFYELKFGRRLNTTGIPGLTLDAFAKYQHWKEQYDAFGVTQITCIASGILCDTEGNSSFEDTNVITNTS